MRIGIICHSCMGGSARIASQLACALAGRGHEIHLFSRAGPFWKCDSQALICHRLPQAKSKFDPSALPIRWPPDELAALEDRIIKTISRHRLEILHFHYALPFARLLANVKKKLGARSPLLLGTLHGTDVSLYGRQSPFREELSATVPLFDRVTTVSQSHARLATEVFALVRSPEVIPNFVDQAIFHPPKREESEPIQSFDSPILCHVSNFRPIKNSIAVAQIFHRVLKKLETRLWLIGTGPDLPAVRTFLESHGLQKKTRFFGPRKNLAPLLARTSLQLVTSLGESFCLASLEAMACGVPVVASRVGGLPEVVTHGVSGLLYPVDDLDAGAEAVLSILTNPARAKAFSEAGIRRAGNFEINTIVDRYEKLYQEINRAGRAPVAGSL